VNLYEAIEWSAGRWRECYVYVRWVKRGAWGPSSRLDCLSSRALKSGIVTSVSDPRLGPALLRLRVN
jgi:hypothetical protein